LLPKKKTSSGFEFVSGLADGASAMPAKWSRPVFSFRFYEGKISGALIVIQHLGGKHTARRHRAPRLTPLMPAGLAASSLKTEPQKEHDMTIYPVEFQRRLEQKWARRIDQIIAVTGNATPPRDPKEDDDYEDEGEEKPRRCQYGYQA
jgi:hypothetical protein